MLKVLAAAPQLVVARQAQGGRGAASHASLRILLAEDNVVNQKVAVSLLSRLGHVVTVAANGQLAIDAYRSQTFDLILMDVQMPVLSGFDATAAIREIERHTGAHVPIVAMTARAMKGDRERCLQAGMDDYMSKPIQGQHVMEVIWRTLSSSAGRAGCVARPLPSMRAPRSRWSAAITRRCDRSRICVSSRPRTCSMKSSGR